jgi:hypothetical protein
MEMIPGALNSKVRRLPLRIVFFISEAYTRCNACRVSAVRQLLSFLEDVVLLTGSVTRNLGELQDIVVYLCCRSLLKSFVESEPRYGFRPSVSKPS